jgi:ParB/RepB/Spo0J family partition protein
VSAAEAPPPDVVDAVKLFLKAAAGAVKEAEDEDAKNKDQLPDIVGKARSILEQRRNLARRRSRKLNPPKEGPSDGEMMNLLALDVRMVPLSKIFVDPDFDYARVNEDPLHPEWYSNEGQHLSDLEETMREEGLKDPIEVQVKGDEFMLRAGTRRWKVAKKLNWESIPATVIPQDIPIEWQYWSSVIRNTARKSLGTYEVAVSAKVARDKYNTPPPDFARKAGYTAGYVYNLLRCLDRLPDYLIEQWKGGARVTLDQWITLSHLDHIDAIKLYRKWMGYTPIDRLRDVSKNARRKPLPPARWVDRMMKLYVGVEGSDLSPRERDIVLHAIEHCMGTRDGIPGVYEPKKHKQYEKKMRLRAELKMPDVPDPGEEKEMPPPRDEDGDERPGSAMRMANGNWRPPGNTNTSSAIEEAFDGRRDAEKRRREKRELDLVRDS